MRFTSPSSIKLAVAALLLALTCAATGQPVATARISGAVTMQATEPLTGSVSVLAAKPVENAVVTLESVFSRAIVAETKTDANGRYAFPDVKPAVYGLVAKTKTLCAISSAVNATDGSETIVHLYMKERSLCSGPALQFTH